MRLRTQKEIMEAVKRDDPGSALTAYALRQKVLSGEVKSVAVGRKRLIDLDTLPAQLAAQAAQAVPPGGVWRTIE